MEAIMTLGGSIRRLRRANEMTLAQVGEELGLPYQSVQKWEADKSVPNANQLSALAKLFNVGVDDLLGDSLAIGNFKSILQEGLKQITNLPLISVNNRQNLLTHYVDNTSILALPETYPVSVSGITLNEGHVVIEIDGDMMEPKLSAGAKVLAEAVTPDNFPHEHGGIYAILFGRRFAVRRIVNNDISEHGKLFLTAENAKYDPLPVDAKSIRAMWKVVRIVDAPIH